MTHSPAGPATRTLRAAVLAALVVLLAGLGQVLVTGRPLPLGTLALAGGAVFAVLLLLSGPRVLGRPADAGTGRGFLRVAALFVPLELGLSALFDLAQRTCPDLPPGGAHGFEPLLCAGGSLGGFLLGHGVASTAGVLLLVALHGAIALAAAFWFSRADAALATVVRAAGTVRDCARQVLAAALRRLLLLTAVPSRPVVRVPLPRDSRPRVPAEPVVLRPAVRRGPPVLVPAC